MPVRAPLLAAIEALQRFRADLGAAAIDATGQALRRIAGAHGEPSRPQRNFQFTPEVGKGTMEACRLEIP